MKQKSGQKNFNVLKSQDRNEVILKKKTPAVMIEALHESYSKKYRKISEKLGP